MKRILFISHSYPPIVGGVENQNYSLSQNLKRAAEVHVIANGHGKRRLPVFLPFAFVKALILMANADTCLLGSGVLAPLGAALKLFYPRKGFFCVVHGLDVTFAFKSGLFPAIYRSVNVPSLSRLDGLIAVSNATVEEAVSAGVDRSRCVFIPNAVSTADLVESHDRDELSHLWGGSLEAKKVILRLGRFVPHKGTSWFIDNVMPRLPANVVLIAAGGRVSPDTPGDEDDFLNCRAAIERRHLEDRARLLPFLPWSDVKVLLNTVDLVVSPNVEVPGSLEGFGLNVIEAGACGRPVVASRLGGLADAIQDGANGFLVESGNTDEWVRKVSEVLNASEDDTRMFGRRAADYVRRNFDWGPVCRRYLQVMYSTISDSKHGNDRR